MTLKIKLFIIEFQDDNFLRTEIPDLNFSMLTPEYFTFIIKEFKLKSNYNNFCFQLILQFNNYYYNPIFLTIYNKNTSYYINHNSENSISFNIIDNKLSNCNITIKTNFFFLSRIVHQNIFPPEKYINEIKHYLDTSGEP